MKKSFSTIAIATVFLALVGCGKSEAEKAREAAQLKFSEKVAAIKICTQGSTYSEFRQAELDLRTSYEVNKANLENIHDKFSVLDECMAATDTCWSYSISDPKTPCFPAADWQGKLWKSLQFLSPVIAKKSKYNLGQIEADPDFFPKNYVQTGLTKVSSQAEDLLNLLQKQN